MSIKRFANTTTLTNLVMRRDRISIPIWIICIVGFTIAVVLAFPNLYPSGPERQIIAETMRNPAMIAMLGPGYGLDNYHLGAILAHQMLLFTAMAVAIMNILLVIRHTRRDEEAGRIELIRSLPVGKLSNVGSALLVLTITNVLLGIVTGLGLAVLGLESIDLSSSLLYGAVLTVTGIFFAGITAFFAQLTETSRAALGYSFGFLGLAYLLRAMGDIGNEALALISPLGLILRTQVYVNNYWWPIWLTLLFAIAVLLITFKLNQMRDLEAGFIAAKSGNRYASRFLQNPLGLCLRLERTTIIAWAIGLFILGASYGSIFGDAESFFETSDLYKMILPDIEGFSLTEQFTATLIAIMSMISAVPVLLVLLKLRTEEKAKRLEHLLARAVPKVKLVGSFLLIAAAVAFLMQILSILGLWSAAVSVMDEPIELMPLFLGAMAYMPAIFVFIGIATVLIAAVPKLTNLTWLYLGYSFIVIYFGTLLQIPDWMAKLSPFGYVPNVPLESWSIGPAMFWLFLAVVLIAIGFYGYQKRDLLTEA